MEKLKPKIPSTLFECLVRTIHADGRIEHRVRYDVTIRGESLVNLGEWLDEQQVPANQIVLLLCEVFPELKTEEALQLYQQRELML